MNATEAVEVELPPLTRCRSTAVQSSGAQEHRAVTAPRLDDDLHPSHVMRIAARGRPLDVPNVARAREARQRARRQRGRSLSIFVGGSGSTRPDGSARRVAGVGGSGAMDCPRCASTHGKACRPHAAAAPADHGVDGGAGQQSSAAVPPRVTLTSSNGDERPPGLLLISAHAARWPARLARKAVVAPKLRTFSCFTFGAFCGIPPAAMPRRARPRPVPRRGCPTKRTTPRAARRVEREHRLRRARLTHPRLEVLALNYSAPPLRRSNRRQVRRASRERARVRACAVESLRCPGERRAGACVGRAFSAPRRRGVRENSSSPSPHLHRAGLA